MQKVVARMGDTGHRRNPIHSLCNTILLDIFGILALCVELPSACIVLGTVLLLWFHHSHTFRECQPWLFVIHNLVYLDLLFSVWGVICIVPLIWLTLSRYCNFKHDVFIFRSFDFICLFPAQIWDMVGAEKTINCFVKRTHYIRPFLSSPKAFDLFSDVTMRRNHKGPSLQVGVRDLVPGLVCSGPFPCINGFTRRNR